MVVPQSAVRISPSHITRQEGPRPRRPTKSPAVPVFARRCHHARSPSFSRRALARRPRCCESRARARADPGTCTRTTGCIEHRIRLLECNGGCRFSTAQ